jgi:hypothetical protein
VGYVRQCMCRGFHFLWKNKLCIKDRIFFIHQSTVLAVKRVEFVSDRMSHERL